jgi:cell wall-associated NlpC family hydrolase
MPNPSFARLFSALCTAFFLAAAFARAGAAELPETAGTLGASGAVAVVTSVAKEEASAPKVSLPQDRAEMRQEAVASISGAKEVLFPEPKASLPEPKASSPEPALSLPERYASAVQDVLLKGLEMVGIGYRFGGTGLDGLDCSGYVQAVYREALGLMLPRTARGQADVGSRVGRAELKPGDLVFFNTMRRAFSHVGIYLGDDYFLHAPSSGGFVRLEYMQDSYWGKRFDGARRILPE